jgi:hypothetical protein
MAEAQTRTCRYCFGDINSRATVCHHCSRGQNPLGNFIKLADVISFCLLLVAFFQLFEAFQANRTAEEALNTAMATQTRAAAANSKAEVLWKKLQRSSDAYWRPSTMFWKLRRLSP